MPSNFWSLGYISLSPFLFRNIDFGVSPPLIFFDGMDLSLSGFPGRYGILLFRLESIRSSPFSRTKTYIRFPSGLLFSLDYHLDGEKSQSKKTKILPYPIGFRLLMRTIKALGLFWRSTTSRLPEFDRKIRRGLERYSWVSTTTIEKSVCPRRSKR